MHFGMLLYWGGIGYVLRELGYIRTRLYTAQNHLIRQNLEMANDAVR